MRLIRELEAQQTHTVIWPNEILPDESKDGYAIIMDDADRISMDELDAMQNRVSNHLAQGFNILIIQTKKDPEKGSLDLLPVTQKEMQPLKAEAIESYLRAQKITGATAIVLSKRLHAHLSGNIGLTIECLYQIIAKKWLKETAAGKLKSSIPIEEMRSRPLPIPGALKNEKVLSGIPTITRVKIAQNSSFFGQK